MQGTTHMLGGALAAGAVAAFMPETTTVVPVIVSMGMGAVGGLIPDIDHAHSKISKALWPIGEITSRIFTHRGVLHAPILYILLLVAWTLFVNNVTILVCGTMVFAGIASHLVLDCLNPTGIPLLYPLERKRYHFARIRTGGSMESAVRVVLVVACLGVGVLANGPIVGLA